MEIALVQNDWQLVTRIPHGLVQPVVRVAALHVLHFQVNGRIVGDHIRGIRGAAELLAPTSRAAHHLGPGSCGHAFPAGTLLA